MLPQKVNTFSLEAFDVGMLKAPWVSQLNFGIVTQFHHYPLISSLIFINHCFFISWTFLPVLKHHPVFWQTWHCFVSALAQAQ